MNVYGSVCVGRLGMFGGKSGITRRILGVLGRMRTGCVGIEVEHVFQKKRLGGRCLRHLPPISSNHHQVAFFRCIHCYNQGLLVTLHLDAYYGLYYQKTGSIRATRCWLWFCTRWDNPFPASCYSRNVGVHVTFDINRLPPIHFSTKDTLRVSCWSLSCLEAPVVWGFGEVALQKTGILQFFYRSRKVCTRRAEHSSIPHLWWPVTPANGFVGKEVFTFKKILPRRRGKLQRDKGIEDRVTSKIWVD